MSEQGRKVTVASKPLVTAGSAPTRFLSNAAATFYTVPASPDNTVTLVRLIVLCNTDTADHTVRIHNIASGGAAAASNAIYYDVSIPANTTAKFCFDDWVMVAGGFIQALADATDKVTISIFGDEVSP